MITFTAVTRRKKWLVVEIPDTLSVVIFNESKEPGARKIPPVILSDMSDALAYLAEMIRYDSARILYRGKPCGAVCATPHVAMASAAIGDAKVFHTLRDALEYVYDAVFGEVCRT